MNTIWRLAKQHSRKCLTYYKTLPALRAVGLSFVPLVHAINFADIDKIEIPNQKNLSHEHLIQQAASVSVSAASQLLTQTTVAILDISTDYKKAILDLMSLLEESQNGIIEVNNEMNEAILSCRDRVSEFQKQLLELYSLLDYVEKVVLSTAETSYLIGAEFVSATLSERFYSAKIQLEEKRKEVACLESECLLLQKNIIIDTKL